MEVINCTTQLTEAGILYFRCCPGRWRSYQGGRWQEACFLLQGSWSDHQLAAWAGLGTTALSLLYGGTSKASTETTHHTGVPGSELPPVLSSEMNYRVKKQGIKINVWHDFFFVPDPPCEALQNTSLCPQFWFFSSFCTLGSWSSVPSEDDKPYIAKPCNHISVSIMVLF